jgi:phosphoribosylformylglycinamidine synthase subunit PurS
LKISAIVTLKENVLDPQGKVISLTLKDMGYKNVVNVRQGKFFEIELNETDEVKGKKIVENICKNLLTNLVIENYTILLK